MDRDRFSELAFRRHTIMSPLSPQTVDELVDAIAPVDGMRIVDLGCGKGELLLRLAQRAAIDGAGIERNPAHVAAARSEAERRGLSGRARFAVQDVAELDTRVNPSHLGAFDMAICMGAGSAFGDLRGTITVASGLVGPGGLVLFDSGYWRKPPDPAYLAVLGAPADEHGTHAENVALGERADLSLLYARTSSQGEWDHFEGLYLSGVERWVAAHPEEPGGAAMRAHIRRWRDAYYRWGRDTLGYGVYLFQREGRPRLPWV